MAVLGGGRLGSRIALTFSSCGASVHVTARSKATVEKLRSLGLRASTCNVCAVSESDYVIVTVKPWQVADVAREVSGTVKGRVVVSFAAGVERSIVERLFSGSEAYRAMASILVGVEGSHVALAPPPKPRRLGETVNILSCLGRVHLVPEQLLDAWTAVVGSGPALVAEILDALMLAAVAVGIPWSQARELVLGMVRAVAAYLERNPIHPLQLRDEVITPAGTTIKGLTVFNEAGVKATLIRAFEEAARRSRELAGNR